MWQCPHMDEKFYGALGSIIAAMIAGILALIGLVISKESKLSEFRQAWIDGLRKEIATLSANLLMIRRFVAEQSENQDAARDTRQALIAADTSLFLIRLRLNPDEVASKDVLDTLDEIERFSNQAGHPIEETDKLERKLISGARTVLKTEWVRVKHGERTYRLVKGAAQWLVMILALIFIVSVVISLATTAEMAPAKSELARPPLERATPTTTAIPTSVPEPLNLQRPSRVPGVREFGSSGVREFRGHNTGVPGTQY